MPKEIINELGAAASKGNLVEVLNILSTKPQNQLLDKMLDGFGYFLYSQGLYLRSFAGKKMADEFFAKARDCFKRVRERSFDDFSRKAIFPNSDLLAASSAMLLPQSSDDPLGSRLWQLFFAAINLPVNAEKAMERFLDHFSKSMADANVIPICYLLSHQDLDLTPKTTDILLRGFMRGSYQFGLRHVSLRLPSLKLAWSCFQNINNKTASDYIFIASCCTSIPAGSIEFPEERVEQALNRLQKLLVDCHLVLKKYSENDGDALILGARLHLEKQIAMLELEQQKYSLFEAVAQQNGWIAEKLYNWVTEYMNAHLCSEVSNLPHSTLITALSESLNATIIVSNENVADPIVISRPNPKETIYLSLTNGRELMGRYHVGVRPKSESASLTLHDVSLPDSAPYSADDIQEIFDDHRLSESIKGTEGAFYRAGYSGKLSEIIKILDRFPGKREINIRDQLFAGLTAFFYHQGVELRRKGNMSEANIFFQHVLSASHYVEQKCMVYDIIKRLDEPMLSASNRSISFFSGENLPPSKTPAEEPELLIFCNKLSAKDLILTPAIKDSYLLERATSLARNVDIDNLNEVVDCLTSISKKTLSEELSLISCYNQLASLFFANKQLFQAKYYCTLAEEIGDTLSVKNILTVTIQDELANATELLSETNKLKQKIKVKLGSSNKAEHLTSRPSVPKDLSKLSAAAAEPNDYSSITPSMYRF